MAGLPNEAAPAILDEQRSVRSRYCYCGKAAHSKAAFEAGRRCLGHNLVRALPRVALCRFDLQPELLDNVPADESPDAVVCRKPSFFIQPTKTSFSGFRLKAYQERESA